MTDPTLVPLNALAGVRVALSVSESQDLDRLGLTPRHLDLVVAEVARAVILAGGTVVYGGRIRPAGFTQVVIDEIHRYGDDRKALEIYVPASEHCDISREDLVEIDQRLGTTGALYLLTPDGESQSVKQRQCHSVNGLGSSEAASLTAMRQRVANDTDARIVLGGKLNGFRGSEPGVIEEARLTLEAGRSLYVAGGYGGAAAAIARTLEFDSFHWAPQGFPAGVHSESIAVALDSLRNAYSQKGNADGLSPEERRVLAVSHRPANIATAVVLGLSRITGGSSSGRD